MPCLEVTTSCADSEALTLEIRRSVAALSAKVSPYIKEVYGDFFALYESFTI